MYFLKKKKQKNNIDRTFTDLILLDSDAVKKNNNPAQTLNTNTLLRSEC